MGTCDGAEVCEISVVSYFMLFHKPFTIQRNNCQSLLKQNVLKYLQTEKMNKFPYTKKPLVDPIITIN